MIPIRLLIAFALCVLASRESVAEPPLDDGWAYKPSLLRPFWQGEEVEGESVLFIREATGEAKGATFFGSGRALHWGRQ